MATEGSNLSKYNKDFVPDGAGFKIGIVVSSWNEKITSNLLLGAHQTLLDNGVEEHNIIIKHVPGAFELPLACQMMLETNKFDGIIAIGVVIQGETKHFDYVCAGTTHGLMNVMIKHSKPIAFCVLTDENEQQSIDRSGGKHGNKGVECAVACLKMIDFK
ncbi:MAG: 6,7-dimethyl-8-ribityllumazine synthase [Flavobacteriia bacterium]|nr:6,7-dimethyl-8-ribityllumazine synthase [Flavobacteriia bacterium]